MDARRRVVILLGAALLSCGLPAASLSSGVLAGDVATGAHALAFYAYQASGSPSLTTSSMTTQSSGSTILVGVGRGNSLAHATPTDNRGNIYKQVGTSHNYTNWPSSGTALYAAQGTSGGGSGHQVTVSTAAYDETTVGVVEVQNGGSIEDYRWNEDLTNPTTSLSVTTTGPAVLVAFWFGDGGLGSVHTAAPSAGFSIVEELTLDAPLVQLTVATRFVPVPGTYSVEWSSTSGEGAQLYLVAVRAAVTPGLTVVSPNGGESWPVGSQQQIRWTAQAIGSSSTVRVSLVNGASTTVLATVPSTQTSLDWTVSGSPATGARVRVECVGCASAVQDDSDATFSIVAAPSPPPVPSDFNADGRPDLLWHHQVMGDLYVWLLSGTVAASGSYLDPPRFADTRWQIRGLADFNADGKVDVLWHHQATGDLYVWFLNGTRVTSGGFLNPRSFSDTRWQIRGVTDLNKDGKPDILWHNQVTGDLYVWFLNGLAVTTGSYLNPRSFSDTRWQIRGVADLNRDGKPDLLWHHQGTGDLYVWFLNGLAVSWGSYLDPSRFADTRWQIRRLTDLNDDGQPDVLWHHQATGDLYVWFLNGVAVSGGSYLTPSRFTDTRWQIVPR